MIAAVAKHVVDAGGVLINESEAVRADESSLPVRVLEAIGAKKNRRIQPQEDSAIAPVSGSISSAVVDYVGGPSSVFQSESRYAFLFRLGVTYWTIHFWIRNPLQFMASKTAESFYSCFDNVSMQFQLPAKALRRQRVVASDGDGAIAKEERVRRQLNPGTHLLHKICGVHTATNRKKDVFKQMVPESISDATAVNLVFRGASTAHSFRKELVVSVLDMLHWDTINVPRNAPIALLKKGLDLYVGGKGNKSKWRRAIIESHLNGGVEIDTYDRRLTHFELACNGCSDEDCCRKRFAEDFTAAIMPRPPKNFPCRNWIGCEDTYDFIGLLEFLGDLFSKTFPRWCANKYREVDIERGSHANADQLRLGDEPPPEQQHDRSLDSTGNNVEPPASDPVLENTTLPDWAKRQQENKGFRKRVRDSCRSNLLGLVCVIRQTMECFREYVAATLHNSSERSKSKEVYKHSAAVGPTEIPKYPMVRAYFAEEEMKFMSQIRNRFNVLSYYDTVPPTHRTMRLNCLAGRMLSKAGCMVQNILDQKRDYPNLLVKALLEPEFLDYIMDPQGERRCRFDEFTLDFVSSWEAGYPDNRNDVLHDILHTISLAQEETVWQEHSWAWVRRALRINDQGWNMSAKDTNMRWILKFFDMYRKKMRPQDEGDAEASKEGTSADTSNGSHVKKIHKIRAFNLFLHNTSIGSTGRPSLAAAWKQFKAQSPEELERLNLQVEEVNKSSMPGGMKKRSIQRVTHKEDAMRSVAKRLVEGNQGGDDTTTCTDVALRNDACSSRDLVPMTGLSAYKFGLVMSSRSENRISKDEARYAREIMNSEDGGKEILRQAAGSIIAKRDGEKQFIPATRSGATSHKLLEWSSPELTDRAKALASVSLKSMEGQKVLGLAKQVEETMCETVKLADNDAFQTCPVVHRRCNENRCCICISSMADHNKINASIQVVIKSFSRRSRMEKQMLDTAYIGLICIGDLVQGDAPMPRLDSRLVHFLHIGDLDRKPWRPHFHVWRCGHFNADWQNNRLLDLSPFYLEEDDQYLSNIEATKLLNEQYSWRIGFYQFVDSEELLLGLCPGIQVGIGIFWKHSS